MNILIAGVGNVLRGDDGFGVAVAQNLIASSKFGSEVMVFEAGIAGIALVQELMSGYDLLIIADSIQRGGAPGTIYLIEPKIPKIEENSPVELHQSLADAHYSDPAKVLMLAKALNVLPAKVFLIGCEPAGYDELGAALSPPVQRAVGLALEKIESLIKDPSQLDDLT